ncbi:GAF domain-containing protein [Persicobacter diffluens]
MNDFAKAFHHSLIESQQRALMRDAIVSFEQALRQQQGVSFDTAANVWLKNIISHTDASMGGLYIIERDEGENILKLSAAYAFGRQKYLDQKIEIGEGLIGQAYLEKQPIFMTDIPEDYLKIRSGLGDASPRSLLIYPMLLHDRVIGILELASFHVLDDFKMDFIRQVGESLASHIEMVRYAEQTALLLQETQEKEEELRQNLEEISATQEQLERMQKEQRVQAEQHQTLMLDILDHVDGKVYLKDLDGKFLLVNQRFADEYGVSKDQLIGKSDFEFFTREKAEEFQKEEKRLIQLGKKCTTKKWVEFKGETKYWQVEKIPIFNPVTGRSGLLGIHFELQEEYASYQN